MRIALLAMLGLGLMTAHASAGATGSCGRGDVIYRVTVTSLAAGTPIDNLGGAIKKQVFEVRSGGTWERLDDDKVAAKGCMARADLRLFQDAVRRTKLQIDNRSSRGACIHAPSRRVLTELPGRKLRREAREPCGPLLDATGGRLFSCLWATMDPTLAPAHVTQVCTEG